MSTAPTIDESFKRRWKAEVLPKRPLILPERRYVYPAQVEEVERGALEVLVRPPAKDAQPFLATCALGFRDPAAPTGLWCCPRQDEMCAISGGYAYLIDTNRPERFTMLEMRPVLEVRPLATRGLLLFIGHFSMVAWGEQGLAWQTGKLSDEGLSITRLEPKVLHGKGWNMLADKEVPFSLDLRTGKKIRRV